MSDEYGEANIVRVRKDSRYFVASNVPFNDHRLTWEARGVMGYLLSKPDDWQIRMGDLINQSPAKIKAVRRILAELRAAGYMSRERVSVSHGHFAWITTIYESPELNKSTIYPLRIDGSRIDAQGADIVSTDSLSTELRYKDISKKITELKFVINPNTPTLISFWLDDFTNEEIFRALEMSKGKSINYADKILIGWKANGVPPTREEQIASAKSAPRPYVNKKQAEMDATKSMLADWVAQNGG